MTPASCQSLIKRQALEIQRLTDQVESLKKLIIAMQQEQEKPQTPWTLPRLPWDWSLPPDEQAK